MFKILIHILVASALLSATPAYAKPPRYEMLPEKSTLKFYAIQNGAPLEGQFKTFTTAIYFDEKALDQSGVTVEVDMGSVSASNDDVVKNLKLPEWFSVAKFPKTNFTSTKIVRMPGTDNYYMEGELTLRGIKKPAVINFALESIDTSRMLAKGSMTLHRNDYGVGQGEWKSDELIKNEVRIEFRIVADKK